MVEWAELRATKRRIILLNDRVLILLLGLSNEKETQHEPLDTLFNFSQHHHFLASRGRVDEKFWSILIMRYAEYTIHILFI